MKVVEDFETYGYVFHDTNGRNPWKKLKIPWYLLNEICMDTPLAVSLWERQFEEVLLELAWKKYQIWECIRG